MPKFIYSINLSAPPLVVAAQALTVARVQGFAQQRCLMTEEKLGQHRRDFLLVIPLDELNGVLDELSLQGLLNPTQLISGRPSAHIILSERFATLTWVDAEE